MNKEKRNLTERLGFGVRTIQFAPMPILVLVQVSNHIPGIQAEDALLSGRGREFGRLEKTLRGGVVGVLQGFINHRRRQTVSAPSSTRAAYDVSSVNP